MINTEQLSSPLSQVLKTYDFGSIMNYEIDITLIYPHLLLLMYHVCRNVNRSPPLPVGICISGTYCLLLLPSPKEIFHFKGRLIDVVGFSTIPAAGDGTLTYHLHVSLVSSQMETVSKTCHFKLGDYCLALLNSPQKEAYEHLFKDLLAI